MNRVLKQSDLKQHRECFEIQGVLSASQGYQEYVHKNYYQADKHIAINLGTGQPRLMDGIRALSEVKLVALV